MRLEHELLALVGCRNLDQINILLVLLGQFVEFFICSAKLLLDFELVGHEPLNLGVPPAELLVY